MWNLSILSLQQCISSFIFYKSNVLKTCIKIYIELLNNDKQLHKNILRTETTEK